MITTKDIIVEKRGNGGEDRAIRNVNDLPVISFSKAEKRFLDDLSVMHRVRSISKGVGLMLIMLIYFTLTTYFSVIPSWTSIIAVIIGVIGFIHIAKAICLAKVAQPSFCEEGCRGMALQKYIQIETLKMGFIPIKIKHRYIVVRIEDCEDVVRDVICNKSEFKKMKCGGSIIVIKRGKLLYGYRGIY